MHRLASIIFLFSIINQLNAQELFRLDFEESFIPEGWVVTEKSEWGHVLGEDGGNFFRFHPYAARDVLQSPAINLEVGNYVLYYSWNEAAEANPDLCNIRLKQGNGPWEIIGEAGGGNMRGWQKDSVLFQIQAFGPFQLEFEYKSPGRFPAQYLNLDNIYLMRQDISTGLEDLIAHLELSIFPNPASHKLNYRFESIEDLVFMSSVRNHLGQTVKAIGPLRSNLPGSVDISDLPCGIYTLELNYINHQTELRFIIQD